MAKNNNDEPRSLKIRKHQDRQYYGGTRSLQQIHKLIIGEGYHRETSRGMHLTNRWRASYPGLVQLCYWIFACEYLWCAAGRECIADSQNETAAHPIGGIATKTMEIDTRFPTKLDAISDAPEPLRSALVESLPSEKSVRLLVHAPAFSTVGEKTPATVLAVTNDGWLVASETEDGGASVEKSDFSETLFLELTSILLFGQLRIYFATVGTAYSATVKFDTVGEEYYREAIDLILKSVDQTARSHSPE